MNDPDESTSCDPTDDSINGIFFCKGNNVIVLFIFLCGALIRHLTVVLFLPIPYTVIIFLIGLVFGHFPLGSMDIIDPHEIMLIFLPLLIFEGAFGIDMYIFKQLFLQILILAVPVVATCTFTIGIICQYLFEDYWRLSEVMLLGAILSATDPVAVVSIMKELGTSKKFSLLIEGESLLNDGTALVVFSLLFSSVKGEEVTIMEVIKNGCQLSLGGPAFGWIIAKITVFWLNWTFNDSLTEISVTFSLAYLTFYIAENILHVSSVLAVVTYGAMLSAHRTAISPEVESILHSFWETMGFWANTLIFALTGIVISNKVLAEAEFSDFMNFAILYCMLNITRGLSILLFAPFLKRIGYGLSWQEALVLTWSGLRGAVGLALALIVHGEMLITDKIRKKILFHVSCVVIGTLLINATTITGLLTFVGLTSVNQERKQTMKKTIKVLDERREKVIKIAKSDRFLSDADWIRVSEMCTIEDPFKTLETQEDREIEEIVCPHCNEVINFIPLSNRDIQNMTLEVTKKYLKLLKQNCKHQFEIGILSGYSLRKVTEMLDQAIDNDDTSMIDVYKFRKLWKTPNFLHSIQSYLTRFTVMQGSNSHNLLNSESVYKGIIYELSECGALLVLVYGMDALQIIITLFLVGEGDIVPQNFKRGLHHINIMMVVIIGLYFMARICHHRFRYAASIWFFVNGSTLILGMYDVAASAMLNDGDAVFLHFDDDHSHYDRLQFLIYLRSLRLLSLLEIWVLAAKQYILSYIKNFLTCAADVTRAYVRASDQVIKKIDGFSDNVDVCETIRKNAENNKLKVLREIGFLQGLHPDIMLGVKTHQAIRSVLNVMRDGIYELLEDGGIEESEGFIFIKVIESKMKKLQNAPPVMEFPSVESILAVIPWIEKEPPLINLITKIAEPKTFELGKTIMNYGDKSDGIYIIISGLVKVEVPITDSGTNLADDSSIQYQFRTLDFLSTGNVIGEISVLAQRPRSATLTCETQVKTLFLNIHNLAMIFDVFASLRPPLIDRLWMICAIRISVNVLTKVPHYHGMNKEALMSRLKYGIVEPISQSKKLIEISPRVVDTVLIMGTVCDRNGNVTYVGPCYIPKHARTLKLVSHKDQTAVFFFILKMQKQKKHVGFEKYSMTYSEGLNEIDF